MCAHSWLTLPYTWNWQSVSISSSPTENKTYAKSHSNPIWWPIPSESTCTPVWTRSPSCVWHWPHGYSLPGFSVHRISQKRLDGLPFLLLGVFPTHGSSLHLLHWQTRFLPQLGHLGSPVWMLLQDFLFKVDTSLPSLYFGDYCDFMTCSYQQNTREFFPYPCASLACLCYRQPCPE